jgi:IS30 family transposase
MLAMNQIDQIEELQRQDYGAKEIAARLSIDRKTTARYMQREDFNAAVAPNRQVQIGLPRA